MNAKSRQEMGLVRARVVAVERQGKVDAFTVCSAERAHWACQRLAVGERLHREAVGCSPEGTLGDPCSEGQLLLSVSVLAMVWEVPREGKGDPFFPRLSFIDRASEALLSPQVSAL